MCSNWWQTCIHAMAHLLVLEPWDWNCTWQKPIRKWTHKYPHQSFSGCKKLPTKITSLHLHTDIAKGWTLKCLFVLQCLYRQVGGSVLATLAGSLWPINLKIQFYWITHNSKQCRHGMALNIFSAMSPPVHVSIYKSKIVMLSLMTRTDYWKS